MSSRFNLQPDSRFEPLRSVLRERVHSAANALDAESFADVLDAPMRSLLNEAFAAAGAHEGMVWLAERTTEVPNEVASLVAVYNTGPNAEQIVGKFRQPIERGLISAVFAYEQPFCENEVNTNDKQDKTLDRSLGVETVAMIAVPIYFAGSARGIVSCVQLKPAGVASDPPGFTMDSLRHVQLAAEVLSRLIDHRLVGVTVGYQPE